jgi:hypothetical protein
MAEIQAMFRVNKNNVFTSNIQYAIGFMHDRLLFVKIGGEFADGGKAIAGMAIGGVVGGVIGATMDKRDAQKNHKDPILLRLREISRDELLELDKHNFEIGYDKIAQIKLTKSSFNIVYSKSRNGVLIIETIDQKPHKFDLSVRDGYEDCRNTILQFLPNKLVS